MCIVIHSVAVLVELSSFHVPSAISSTIEQMRPRIISNLEGGTVYTSMHATSTQKKLNVKNSALDRTPKNKPSEGLHLQPLGAVGEGMTKATSSSSINRKLQRIHCVQTYIINRHGISSSAG